MAHAQVRIDNVRQQLLAIAAQVNELGCAGEPCPEKEQARLRLNIARTVHEARNIVTDVVSASGASAHFLDNPLQRIQRDINTVIAHTVFDLDVSAEAYGRLLLD